MTLLKLWFCGIRIIWSNFRFRKSIKEYTSKRPKLNSIEDIQQELNFLYGNFEFKYDDVTMLLDAMDTPPSCLNNLENAKLTDDCDGYHAAVYYALKTRLTGVTALNLVSMIAKPFTDSHSMCAFGFEGKMYLIDYINLMEIPAYDDIIKYFEKEYETVCRFYCLDVWAKESGWQNQKILMAQSGSAGQ